MPTTKQPDLGVTQIPNEFFLLNVYDEGDHQPLNPPEFVVLLLLFGSRKNDYTQSRLSTRELARRANISQRQVFRVLKSLVAKRYLRLFGRGQYFEIIQMEKRLRDISNWATENGIWVAPKRP
jgi:hypothetical protein